MTRYKHEIPALSEGCLIISHRGKDNPPDYPAEDYTGPENTLTQLTQRLYEGVPIETDVWLTRDGTAVCYHGRNDGDLRHSTNGKGCISDYTLSQLESVDAGDGNPPPKLEMLLSLMLGLNDPFIIIELKQAGITENLVELLRKFPGLYENFMVSSYYHHGDLRNVRELDPSINTMKVYIETTETSLLGGDAISKAVKDDDSGISPVYRIAKPHYVRRANNSLLYVVTWPVDLLIKAREVLEAGVDGIITNKPGYLRRELQLG